MDKRCIIQQVSSVLCNFLEWYDYVSLQNIFDARLMRPISYKWLRVDQSGVENWRMICGPNAPSAITQIVNDDFDDMVAQMNIAKWHIDGSNGGLLPVQIPFKIQCLTLSHFNWREFLILLRGICQPLQELITFSLDCYGEEPRVYHNMERFISSWKYFMTSTIPPDIYIIPLNHLSLSMRYCTTFTHNSDFRSWFHKQIVWCTSLTLEDCYSLQDCNTASLVHIFAKDLGQKLLNLATCYAKKLELITLISPNPGWLKVDKDCSIKIIRLQQEPEIHTCDLFSASNFCRFNY